VSDDERDLFTLYDEEPPDPGGPVEFDDTPATQAPEATYPSLERFVSDYLLPLYRRAVSGQGTTWCAEWWRHPEAWVRLDAIWRAWEYLRLDPATGISTWLRDHADPHMAVLLSSNGPLRGCKPELHSPRPLAPLPSTAIPDGVPDPTRLQMGGS
jgi:hypothetical protein